MNNLICKLFKKRIKKTYPYIVTLYTRYFKNINCRVTKTNSNLSIEKSFNWLKNHQVKSGGIIISTKKEVSYLEVTGYIIPTLYQWGEKELARNLTNWLIQQQNENGSFSAPDGTPYTFDTGQVIRGFVAALSDQPEVEKPLRKACDWILTQVQPDGRLSTPSTEMWGDIADDRIHLYVLPPLIEAGKKLNESKYIDAANCVLEYYKHQKDLIEFNNLSHFYAYIIEALCDLGETDMAKAGMEVVAKLQRKDGSVPAYKDVLWICSTGVAQFAVIWYKLGMNEYADKAVQYLENIQNQSGGFYGSFGKRANYFPEEEISWAVKYFLDANYLRIKKNNLSTELWNFYRTEFFNEKNRELVEYCKRGDKISILKSIFDEDINHPHMYNDEIFENRFGMQLIFKNIQKIGNDKSYKILDVACGHGELLKRLQASGHQVTGVDISPIRVILNQSNIKNSIFAFAENIPLDSNQFDFIILQECLEHVMNLEQCLKEIFRLLKPEGIVFCQVPNLKYIDDEYHVRLFNIYTLTYVFRVTGFEIISSEIIPYLIGEKNNNIFLISKKPKES